MTKTIEEKLKTILNLYRRDIERHYGGRTVGKTLSGDEAQQALITLIREVGEEVIDEAIAIFDMAEFDPTGTMIDEHMMSRTPGEIANSKRFNSDHSWAALSAQAKLKDFKANRLNKLVGGK